MNVSLQIFESYRPGQRSGLRFSFPNGRSNGDTTTRESIMGGGGYLRHLSRKEAGAGENQLEASRSAKKSIKALTRAARCSCPA